MGCTKSWMSAVNPAVLGLTTRAAPRVIVRQFVPERVRTPSKEDDRQLARHHGSAHLVEHVHARDSPELHIQNHDARRVLRNTGSRLR